MPKELIAAAAASDGQSGFHVKVGWNANQQVQVGVEADGGKSLFWLLLGVGHDDRNGETEKDHLRLAEFGAHVRAAIVESLADDGLAAVGVLASTDDADDPGMRRLDERIARRVLNALDVLAILEYRGVWSTLDRAGCNALIRHTRKARDSAYGRDE